MGQNNKPCVVHYKWVKKPGHPLAHALGKVRLHRLLLWEKIGPGKHPCHWCGTEVEWRMESVGNQNSAKFLLCDHVDNDIHNNDPGNLVPACRGCNSLRDRGGRVKSGDLRIIDKRGKSARAIMTTCKYQKCAKPFIARKIDIARGKGLFCCSQCFGISRRKT